MSTVSLASINGPYVVGYTLCFGLMGTLSVQAYIYFTRFTDDKRAIKILATVLLLEMLITAFTFYEFWASTTQAIAPVSYILVTNPTGPMSSFLTLAPISGLVTTLTHGFYCWRISSIRNSRLIPLPITMVSLLQLASITYLAVTGNLSPSTVADISSGSQTVEYSLSPWLVIWLGSSLICDLAITTCMILSLRPSQSGFASNKSMLVKLTRFTIETGLVTAVAALLELILGVVFDTQMYHVAVFYTISKLYSNCLLVSLNFRLALRSQADPDLTAIVWNDMASRQLDSQAQILARDEFVAKDMNLNEAGPRKTAGSLENQAYGVFKLSVKPIGV